VPAVDTFYQDPQLNDLINEALQAISVAKDWPWLQATELISTVVGTRFYTPNADWQRTKAVSIAGFDAMVWNDLQMIRNWPDDIQDVPVFYTIYLEQIYLAPAPNQIYSLRHDYIIQEPELVNDSDTPFMQSSFHFSIVAFAVYLAHLRSGDLGRAQAAQQEYAAWEKRMTDNRMRSSSTIRPRTRSGRDI